MSTSYCYQESEGRKNSACPVCVSPLNELARRLPFSHCAQSRLICSVSGLPLNEHNPPLMLPNGRVYGLTVCIHHQSLSSLTAYLFIGCFNNNNINPNFSLCFIANVCKQYVESEMTDRSTLVWELLRVKDGLSSLSNEQFNVLDVCNMINWLCTY